MFQFCSKYYFVNQWIKQEILTYTENLKLLKFIQFNTSTDLFPSMIFSYYIYMSLYESIPNWVLFFISIKARFNVTAFFITTLSSLLENSRV